MTFFDQKMQNRCLVSINCSIFHWFQIKYSRRILGQSWPDFGAISMYLGLFWCFLVKKCKIDVWYQLTVEFPHWFQKKYSWGMLAKIDPILAKILNKSQTWKKKWKNQSWDPKNALKKSHFQNCNNHILQNKVRFWSKYWFWKHY